MSAPDWARLVWTAEFLLAMVTAVVLWSEVGGQVHLEMMPWYVKLIPLLAFAWATVSFTKARVLQAGHSGGRSLIWLATMVMIAAVMGMITWYYHMHEPSDDSDDDEGMSTFLHVPAPHRSFPT